MKNVIIGRRNEISILNELLKSNRSELLAIYGRRRVGKTYLIKNYYADHLKFTCSGESGGTMKTQLANFQQQLNIWFPEKKQYQAPANWQQAFVMLRECLTSLKGKGKKVLFFDEFPWLETPKSGFVSAFGYFWNMYLSERPDLLVVVCGSAASWMIRKIINDKGGLHNRITRRLQLQPFSLREVKDYLTYRKIRFSDYQIMQLYMVMGGIPHYLNHVKRGESLHQTINNCCFISNGALTNEFQILFEALFNNHERHIEIIRALSKKNKGFTRKELITSEKMKTGGALTNILEELEASGFIQIITPYNKKKKESLYRLIDEFSLFYLKFMQSDIGKNDWQSISKAPEYLSWCGYAFENVCFRHIRQIKTAIGISEIRSNHSSWYKSGEKGRDGAQIDLLLDRSDDTLTICEIKYTKNLFVIDKGYSRLLQQKLAVFTSEMAPEKSILLTFITPYGVADNDYKQQLVDAEVTFESLFK